MTTTVDMSGFGRLYPFKSHFLNLNGLNYHYLDEGRGEPLVMVHGNPTWSFYYRFLIKSLSDRYRCIAPDHIGCGLSDKPDINIYDFRLQSRVNDLKAFVDHLDLKTKITLVLHDWGGMIGMALAVSRPETIGRLILLNTAAFPPPPGKKLPLRLKIIRNFKPVAVPAVLGFNLFSRAALVMATNKKLSADVKKGLTAPYNNWKNRIATLKFVQDIPLGSRDPSWSLVETVESQLDTLAGKPMLICWGRNDFVFDMDYLSEWQRRFPDAEVHTLSEAGHYVLEDEPHETTRLIENFLEHHPLN